MNYRGILTGILLLMGTIAFLSGRAYASDVLYAPANYYPIGGSNIKEGDIVSFSPKGYILSTSAYDQFMVGIVTSKPAIAQNIQGPIPSYPVVSSGQGLVLVTSANGNIKKGDYLTSSPLPGVAEKAIAAGYTVGVALSDYSSSDTKKIGKIPLSINIHYFIGNASLRSSLLDIFALSTVATYESPSLVVKYLLAATIVSLTLLFGFILISRTANKGIDALARNPLSSIDIHIGIAVNVFIAIVILGVGCIMAFLVLRL